ncbi:beta-eliminating lyase-related protein [Fodinicola feengrottensis]|uniref:Beta-eliminating lyase-related protein n=1 Tax=Fodinicola feengrottensis TaxID=435914 RepID=A0ABN2IK88_9ACTN
MVTRQRRDEVRRASERFLQMHGPTVMADQLTDLASRARGRDRDSYGTGELIEELEGRLADLFGTEAAVFLPSGTMAQQIALRIWAEQAGRDTVGLHPLTHLEVHELGAVWELHRLRPRFLTDAPRQPTLDDLAAVAEPLGSVVVELPLREADFQLPTWDELSGFAAAVGERGARLHVDGARLWESTAHLGHSLAEIAGLADSVYVSFYKVLGAMSGSALVGPASFVAQARRWQRRHGGTLFAQYPAVLGALRGLDEYLPRVPTYVSYAQKLAARLAELPRVRVNPNPVHTNGFAVYVDADSDRLDEATVAYAAEKKTTTFWWGPTVVPGWSKTEISVGEATLGWKPGEIADTLQELVDRAS